MKFRLAVGCIQTPLQVRQALNKRLRASIAAGVTFAILPTDLQASINSSGNFFRPFAIATRTYDSNLLNQPDNNSGPKSDQIDRFEVGTHVDFQISRQRFSTTLSANQNRHQEFEERNTDGELAKFRWDAEIGQTITGAVEVSTFSGQAPIQTGAVSVIARQQKTKQFGINWNFHPSYAIKTRISEIDTSFESVPGTPDSVLAGLNRTDENQSIGVAYTTGTGSTLGLFLNNSIGNFPLRQVTSPGQSVSNNFEQQDVELQGQWNLSAITRLQFSLATVKRKHDELPARDYSGLNYRIDALYQPTTKSTLTLGFARQIVGVTDVNNSDALVRQIALGYDLKIANKLLMRLAHRPQKLSFSGTDNFSVVAREESLKESSAALEYQSTQFLSLGVNATQRRRESTAVNADYSAKALNFYIKFSH